MADIEVTVHGGNAIPSKNDCFLVARVLRHSKARVLVLLALSSGETLRIADICRRTGLSWNSVKGALMGIPGRFSKDCSPISMSFIEEIYSEDGHRIQGYKITKLGLNVILNIKTRKSGLGISCESVGLGSIYHSVPEYKGDSAPARSPL